MLALLETLQGSVVRLAETLDVPFGLSIEQTADRLDVTAPTIRKWLSEGLLARVAGRRKPIEIDQQSVETVEHALKARPGELPGAQMVAGTGGLPARPDVQSTPSFQKGLEDATRGDLIELRLPARHASDAAPTSATRCASRQPPMKPERHCAVTQTISSNGCART